MIRALTVLALILLAGCDETPVVLLHSNPVAGCPAHTRAVAAETKFGVLPKDRDAFEADLLGESRKLVHVFSFVTCSNGSTAVVQTS